MLDNTYTCHCLPQRSAYSFLSITAQGIDTLMQTGIEHRLDKSICATLLLPPDTSCKLPKKARNRPTNGLTYYCCSFCKQHNKAQGQSACEKTDRPNQQLASNWPEPLSGACIVSTCRGCRGKALQATRSKINIMITATPRLCSPASNCQQTLFLRDCCNRA